jgi:hypothetical protein
VQAAEPKNPAGPSALSSNREASARAYVLTDEGRAVLAACSGSTELAGQDFCFRG